MLRNMLLVGAVALPITALYSTARSQAPAAPPCQVHATEPLLIVSIAGSTLLGGVNTLIAVYSDGQAHYSSITGHPVTGPTISAKSTLLSASDIASLEMALRLSDADELCDQSLFISDIPLTTITAFVGADAAANTFSYFAGVGRYQNIQAVLNDLYDKIVSQP